MIKLFDLIVKYRYFIMITTALVIIFLGYRAKDIEIDFSTRSMYLSDDKELDILAKHRKNFGDDDSTILIVFKSDHIFTPSIIKMIREIGDNIEKIEIPRVELKIDYDKWERDSKKITKRVNFDKEIEKITEDIKTKKGEEIIGDDDDMFEFEDDQNVVKIDKKKVNKIKKDQSLLTPFETPIGKMINPIESVISIANSQHIYGKLDQDGISTMVIEPFIDENDIKNYTYNNLTPLKDLKSKVLKNHLFKDYLVSKDGKTVAIVVKLINILTLDSERKPAIDKIKTIVNNILNKNSETLKKIDIKYGYSGIPIMQGEYSKLIGTDLFLFFFLSASIMGIVLVLIFKKLHGIFIPLTVVSLAAIATFGIMEITKESLNIVNNIIPTLILVIGLSDTIHLLHRYHTEVKRNNKDKKEGIIITFKDLFKACFITSFTTSIGFFSLISAKINIIKNLGIYSGIGILLAFIFIILLIPGILYILPKPKEKMGEEHLSKPLISDNFLDKLNRANIKNPKIVIAIFFMILGVAVYYITKIDVNTHMLEELKEDNKVGKDIKFVQNNLTGILPFEISIRSLEIDKKSGKIKKNSVLKSDILKGMDQLKQFLRKDNTIGFILTVSDFIKESYWASNSSKDSFYKIPEKSDGVDPDRLILNYYDRLKDSEHGERDLENIVTSDGTVARVSFAQDDVGMNAYFKTYKKIDKKLKEIFKNSDTEVTLTGGTYVAYRAIKNIITDMLTSLGIAFILITIVMIVMLKNIKLGLLSMIPNMIPIIFTMGVMGYLGIVVRTSTVLIFSIALGIAVDDSIHFLTRYKIESEKDQFNDGALRRTMFGTGRAIIFTSVLIVLGVLALLFSDFIAIIHYAVLTAITMIAALLSSVYMLPSLLKVINPLKLKQEGYIKDDDSHIEGKFVSLDTSEPLL